MLEVAGIGYGQWVSNFGCMRGSNSDFSSAKPSSSAKSSHCGGHLELLVATFRGILALFVVAVVQNYANLA